MIHLVARILLMLGLLFFAARWANAAEPRRYTPPRPTYTAPSERRALEADRWRQERDQTEELRRLRNDLDDRDHEQKMEGFRERLRDDR